ncbi:MAG: DUF547 domain-containing protein [Desulfohalobiaceae bacterium]
MIMKIFSSIGFTLLLLALPTLLLAAPKADLWDYWTEHDPDSSISVDHSPWSAFLQRSVTQGPKGINRVDYGAVTAEDRNSLGNYLERLTRTKVRSMSRASQKPFWINLYNALTVQVILDHYPVDSIQDIDISPGFFSSGPWGKKLVTIEGKELSLDDIEHRILRPIWEDPRIHYAVNCAALGCPNLQTEAFTAENIEGLLDQGARAYVNHPRGVTIEDANLMVSSIYAWFQEDFGGNESGVIEHLMRYAEPELKKKLQGLSTIDDDRYDWSLNDVPEARP